MHWALLLCVWVLCKCHVADNRTHHVHLASRAGREAHPSGSTSSNITPPSYAEINLEEGNRTGSTASSVLGLAGVTVYPTHTRGSGEPGAPEWRLLWEWCMGSNQPTWPGLSKMFNCVCQMKISCALIINKVNCLKKFSLQPSEENIFISYFCCGQNFSRCHW